jgi:hypothetical protein
VLDPLLCGPLPRPRNTNKKQSRSSPDRLFRERIRRFVHDEDDDDDEHHDRRADDSPEMLECFVFIFTDIKKICKKKQHSIKEIAPNRSALNV